METQFINLFWCVCRKERGCGARQEVQPWVGRARVPRPAGLRSLAPAAADLLPCLALSRGQGSGRLRAGLQGSLLSPKPTCPRGAAPKPCGAARPGSTSLGLPGCGLEEGRGCPGRVKAFQAKIPQQKAGSASELKSKC